jgi:hypothetical protein
MSEMKDINQDIKNSGIPQNTYEKYSQLDDSEIIQLRELLMKEKQTEMANIVEIAIALDEEKLA